MKRTSLWIAMTGLLLGLVAVPMSAAEKETKEVTITGEGKCAKCALKETEKCQNVIQTEEHGKKVTYYVADNKESKAFHKNVCQETQKVKATGVVTEENGKKILTVSKIELDK
jgi:hypothetical protein